jgi:hypothetical protein
LADSSDIEFIEKKLLSLLLKLTKDKISNVRMNTAIILKKLVNITSNREVLSEINNCLEELKKDNDQDVINAINQN